MFFNRKNIKKKKVVTKFIVIDEWLEQQYTYKLLKNTNYSHQKTKRTKKRSV